MLYSQVLKTFVPLILLISLTINQKITAQDKKEGSMLASEIMKTCSANRGLVVACDTAPIAIELAKISQLHFYCNYDTQENVDLHRKLIEDAGLSALRIRVEKGPIEILSYPNFVANLILSTNTITPEKLKEFARILRPDGYLFFIPNKEANPQTGFNDAKTFFSRYGGGNWSEPQKLGNGYFFKRNKIAGAADWSHYFRDPDNNRYSPDQLIHAPFRILWYGEPVSPLGDLFLTQGFSADGRLFLTDASPEDTSRARITCLDAYNGINLWVRQAGGSRFENLGRDRIIQMPGWVYPGSMAVSAEYIYLTDNSECLVMNSQNGKDFARFKAPAPSHPENCWRFVAFQEGLLFGYANAPTPIPSKTPVTNMTLGGPSTIFALDQKSGASRWVRGGAGDELGDSFDRPLAIGEKLIFLRSNKSLFALDTLTGKTIWKTEPLDDATTNIFWEGAVYEGKFMLSKYPVRIFSGKKKITMLTFNTKDGKQETETAANSTNEALFKTQGGFLGSLINPDRGCVDGTAAGNIFFSRNSYSIIKPDATAVNQSTSTGSYGGFRAGCGVGALPANGLVHLLPTGLGCGCSVLQGTATLENNTEIVDKNFKFAPKPETITTLPSTLEKETTPNDWPTYYGDAARSGVTKQNISKIHSLAWEVKVSGSPTPCIAVGDQVFFGSTDECIYALNASNGKINWKYQTNGAIQSAPAYWNGRIYAGSDDGWLYALSAAEGKLLWKIQGGVSNRKQMAFETMSSLWPVRQGLAIDQGKIYFTAGFIPSQGLHAYSVDAITGAVNYHTSMPQTNMTPTSYLVLKPDTVVMPSKRTYNPCVLLRKDGVRQKVQTIMDDFSEARYYEGVETEELGYNHGFLVYGGGEGLQRGYRDGAGYAGRWNKNNGLPYRIFADFFDEGKTKIKIFGTFGDGHSFAPIFTNKSVFMRNKLSLVKINRADFFKFLETKETAANEKAQFYQWNLTDLSCGPVGWIIVSTGEKDTDTTTILAGGPKGISAINDTDGKALWSITWEGSSQPVAIANGKIFTTAINGMIRALK
jgi:outer membrane protein assembly factor BamB